MAVTEAMEDYRFYKALEILQNFFWHDFCDNYIEIVKQRLYSQGEKEDVEAARYTIYTSLLYVLKMLAPICPHITEEIYQRIFKDSEGAISIHSTPWPRVEGIPRDEEAERVGDILVDVIAKIRSVKADRGLRLGATLRSVQVSAPRGTLEILRREEETIKRTLKIQSLTFQDESEIKITIEA
jgi:valyl-tRNA synthetase